MVSTTHGSPPKKPLTVAGVHLHLGFSLPNVPLLETDTFPLQYGNVHVDEI